ncbi:uncharacterized protein VTP21DRAFT_3906 [Calcarisporiella thermophila]|uniref:uncharacterized protein n=1 Tax=Calcarisporiella thermophila TaxID=911321 RepID=UPI00374426F6
MSNSTTKNLKWSEDATTNIITGTGVLALVGATTAGTIAILKNKPPLTYATMTGLNCGIFGVTFFGIRETFLAYQRIKNPQFGLKNSQTRDADDLFSSGMAGATTGALFSTLQKGPRAGIGGFILFGALSTAVQFLYTTGRHVRQEAILNAHREHSGGNETHESKQEGSKLKIESWSPLRKISDEEYIAHLEARLRKVNEDIAACDATIEETRRRVLEQDGDLEKSSS